MWFFTHLLLQKVVFRQSCVSDGATVLPPEISAIYSTESRFLVFGLSCIERSFIFTFSHSCLQITMVLTLKLQNAGNHHCLLVCHPETEKSGIVFRTSCQRHSVSHITWILQDRHHSKDWHTTLHLGEPQNFFFSKQHLFMEIEKESLAAWLVCFTAAVWHIV